MKHIFVVHRWGGTPSSDWYPWIKKELTTWRDQLEVNVLEMPDTETPVIEEWVNYLKRVVPDPDKNTYFVGHSIGCQTIMRYLETFNNIKIGGVLFVAGWLYLKNLEDEGVEKVAKPWLKTPIDFEKVKKSIGQLMVILSSNDPYDYAEKNSKIFRENLGAGIFIEENADHFTDSEYPRILTELLRVLKIVTIASKIN